MSRIFFKRIIVFAILIGGMAFLYWNYFLCQTKFDGRIPEDNKPLIIFDFDGTAADSWDHVVRIMNQISSEYGFKYISKEDQSRYRSMELKQVLKEIGVGTLKLPFVVRRVRTEMQKSLEKIRPAADIKTLFGALKEKQYNVGIVTSNSAENTRKFLKQNNIDNVDFVYSSSCLYGKDKLIKNIMGRASINPTQIYFVGDEIRDVEAAHKAHIKSVAVTWGFSDESLLRQSNPDYIIHNPMELINFIGR